MELVVLPIAAKRSCYVLILFFFVSNLLGDLQCEAQVLPPNEVQALEQVSSKLNIRQWDVSADSCRTVQALTVNYGNGSLSNVTCDCTFNSSTICHVTSIMLNNLDLNGELPVEFGNLTYLRIIDLTRNYLSGSIPRSWGSLPLTKLILLGNLVSGTIPREIGSIATLEVLILQDNNLGGALPPDLGNLGRLRRLHLSGNNFIGVLPESLGSLTNLREFRIEGSNLSGRIPGFIGNWTRLFILDMQGTSMQGPIPSTISLLTNLTELRVSDLDASNIAFPDLRGLTKMVALILRNCSITGQIPTYIGERMKKIRSLDLSFNRLVGPIPDILETLSNLQFMYLTNNLLTGQVSSWLQNTTSNFDISYNNFTGESRGTCETMNLNKIASYPAVEDDSVDWCFKRNLQCPTKPSHYNVFINCGGPTLHFGEENYERDLTVMGPSSFYSTDRWGCSSTGDFRGDERRTYRAESRTNRSDDSIYATARVAPLSLKYYGHCFRQGSYTVNLHFAEIELTADQANNVRGRRIFDVYIQGERVLSNFDIAKEAGGVGKSFIFAKPNVNVAGSTLEIHLYWAGKGTVSLPVRATYGPLISAISVTQNSDVSTELSAGTIAGIVVGAFVAVLLFLAVLWKLGYLGGKDLENKAVDHQICNVESLQLKLTTVAAATENFSEANKLGEGGFGPVYKGKLSDGQEIAVKRLSRNSGQGVAEFENEILLLAKLQHRNLVRLLGFCSEGEEKLLIYEFVINASLDQFIFDPIKRTQLDWGKRYNIIGGIARGLLYLHEDSQARIIHRDLKASNILLNDQMNPKISDFGTARLFMMDQTHANTRRIAGTFGYMPPEYVKHGHFSVKSDVFSFGVLVLELISGKKNTSLFETECAEDLLCYAWRSWREGTALELLDPALRDHYNENEVTRCIHIGLMCVQEDVAKRPTMATVVLMLSSYSVNLALQSPPPRSGSFTTSASMPHSNNQVSVTELSAR